MSGRRGDHDAAEQRAALLGALDAVAAQLEAYGRAPDGSREAQQVAAGLLAATLAVVDANETCGFSIDPEESGSQDPDVAASYPNRIRQHIGLHAAVQHPRRYLQLEGDLAAAVARFLRALDAQAAADPLAAIRQRARRERTLLKKRVLRRRIAAT